MKIKTNRVYLSDIKAFHGNSVSKKASSKYRRSTKERRRKRKKEKKGKTRRKRKKGLDRARGMPPRRVYRRGWITESYGGFMSFRERTGVGYITRPSTRVSRTYNIHVYICMPTRVCVSACVNVCPTRRPRRRSKRCTNFARYGYAEIKKEEKRTKKEKRLQ